METMKEYESFARVGVEPHRSYYIPFAENDKIKTKCGVVDRSSSSRFQILDGTWQIKAHTHEGYASYVFANMHCIAVLKMCLKELQTH